MPEGWSNIAMMGKSKDSEKMIELSMRIGELSASVKALGESSSLTRKELKSEAEKIRDAIETLTAEVFKDFKATDARMDRIERMLAEQEAETRGMMKAMRWGAAALTALGSGIGWVMATWGSAITSALGFGGPPHGGK